MKKFGLYSLGLASVFLVSASPAQAGALITPTNLKLDSIECGELPKAYAYFSWDGNQFATSYRFYSRLDDGKYTSYDEVKDTHYKLGFNPEYNFYVAVSTVADHSQSSGEILESELSNEVYLSAQKLLELCKNLPSSTTSTKEVVSTKEAVKQTGTPASLSALPKKELVQKDQTDQLSQAQAKISELEKKTEDLQKQVTQTQEKTNLLESTVNSIAKFLKNLLGFK